MIVVFIALCIAVAVVILSSLFGMLDTHFAYATHTGGGTYEEINTAGYGRFTVPQGSGRWLYAVHAMEATGAQNQRVKLTMKEWDGEDIIIAMKDLGTIDPDDFTYLRKPRYMPGGATLYIYGLSLSNEAIYVTVLMTDGSPMADIKSHKGESTMVEMDNLANTVANTWTEVRTYKFPATRGPFAIVGGIWSGNTPKIGRLIVPQMPNAFRPPIFAYDTPLAGVEGSTIGKLLEPVLVPANETVKLEALATGAAITTGAILEYVAREGRASVPTSLTTTGQLPLVEGGSGRGSGWGQRMAGARYLMGR